MRTKSGIRTLAAVGLAAGLAWAGRAEAAPTGCFAVHGHYALTNVTLTPDTSDDARCTALGAIACYSGELTGAGFLSGHVFAAITSRAPLAGLSPPTVALFSYKGTTEITTQHGTVNYANAGIFAIDPNSPTPSLPDLIQSDIAIATGGSDWFADPSGHTSSVGLGTTTTFNPTAGMIVISQLNGDISGEICLGGDSITAAGN